MLGDLIHRGPDSRTALKTALNWAKSGRAVLLWGNHEFWVWDEGLSLGSDDQRVWFEREDSELLAEYETAGDGLPELLDDLRLFETLARPYYVEGAMLCAHAARPSLGQSADELLDQGYLWDTPELGLHPLPVQFFPEVTYSVHGHSPQTRPVVDLNGEGVVYLDLGSAKTGRFCVWDSETRRIYEYDAD